ncbi:MAG: hypothetical protein AAB524_02320 [Patescibacteria group bacterium]
MIISQGVQKLIEEYKLWQKETEVREEEEVISVDEVVARVASFYEKIREIVDWREEHLLRKTAIERILKRRLTVYKVNEDFAENFLSELVRGGHFPNNRISFKQVDEIQAIIEKYVFITTHVRNGRNQSKRDSAEWILAIAAVEIEEALSLPRRERALIESMTEDLEARVQLIARKNERGVLLAESEKKLQIYVAVQKALFKLDNSTITYHILEKFYSDWKTPSRETLAYVAEYLDTLRENIQKILSHLHGERFYQLAEKYDTPYLILNDILTEDSDRFGELVTNPAALEGAIQHAYNKRHAKLRSRIGRAALYSVLSVFLTKVLVAIILEIPVERYMGTDPNQLALVLNVAIPSLLMLLLVGTVQTSSQRNFERVMVEVMKIIQVRDRREVYKIFPPRKRSGLGASIVYVFYLLSFIISFGVLVWVLQKLQFPFFSIFIFLMFISLVLFAGTRIRARARELMIEPAREGFLYNLFDIFSLPMIQVGRWLSGKLVRYNVLTLVLNFLIEVPFQMFVEFLEQWRGFLREKKEEIH